MNNVRAKKALGQHFLTNLSAAQSIGESILPWKGIPVLEIGPGMGVLTQVLLDLDFELYLLEIDHESVEYLQKNFPYFADGRCLTEGDVLHLPEEKLIPEKPDTPFVMIGNYPYNISSQIFFRLLDLRDRVSCCAGMLQKEVAERLCASPGGRDYGILTVLLRCWYDAEYLFTVSELDFDPPPKVKGGVLRLVRNQRTSLPCNEALFKKVVKTAFGQRRKTLRNALKSLFGDSYDYSLPIFSLRAERLDVEEYIWLTQEYEKLLQEDCVKEESTKE